jgi:hypothetical protein
MSDFDKYVQKQQVSWRIKNIDNPQYGIQNGKMRAWILPKELWEEGLWPGIRSGSTNSLPDYLKKNNVEKHDGVHNLKSSWILCANLYFPFQQDTEMLAGFLKEKVCPLIKSVEKVELEYAEKAPLDPPSLLGEPDTGKRGKNQTSPDVAFIVNDGQGLILTENKFTEHSFYECSGRKYDNPDPSRCLDFKSLYSDLEKNCNQLRWAIEGRPNRMYWTHLRISEKGRETLTRCPAAISGCQLFRQQALSEGIAKSGKYEFVISCVAYDSRNETLIECMSPAGIDDFTKDWACLFEGKANFATFTHQEWVNWVCKNDGEGHWREWLKYIVERYGY